MDVAQKRYIREFLITMSVYILTVVCTSYLLDRLEDMPWRIPLALLPVIPVVFLLVVFLRYLSAMDELQQRIQLQAIGFAAGATGLLTFAYGFLENVGFLHLSPIYVFPMLVFLWGAGLSYSSRKYQ